MKFAQKWIVVPYHSTITTDPCPPSKSDQIKNDLTHVLKKDIDLNSKVNEYNQVIAKHQQSLHPIVPQQTIQEPKTPYRKSLNFEDDDDDESVETPFDNTIFNTPSGHDPYTSVKNKTKNTIRKTIRNTITNRKSNRKKSSRKQIEFGTDFGIEEKNIIPKGKNTKSLLKSEKNKERLREDRLNLQQNNRSLLRFDDDVQEGNGINPNWKIFV